MKSYTWQTQQKAVESLASLAWEELSQDEIFVLGRNLYQCACGEEYTSMAYMNNLRRELAKIPIEAAIHFFSGMLFEVYFGATGDFRGRKLKGKYLGSLLALQTVKKYSESISFIRKALEPYRSDLLIVPNQKPEIVKLEIEITQGSPPLVKSIRHSGVSLLLQDEVEDISAEHSWRLSVRSFTLETMLKTLGLEWGVPVDQMDIQVEDDVDSDLQLRLEKGSWIASPLQVAK